MIMICEKRPSLQDECIISREFQSRVTEKVQLGVRIEKPFSMKRRRGDYVGAVRRAIMRGGQLSRMPFRTIFRASVEKFCWLLPRKAVRGRTALRKHCMQNVRTR